MSSGKKASSITYAFQDLTGEGLKLMKHSWVGMFRELVSIRNWENRPLLTNAHAAFNLATSLNTAAVKKT
jgi:hypothetical protein